MNAYYVSALFLLLTDNIYHISYLISTSPPSHSCTGTSSCTPFLRYHQAKKLTEKTFSFNLMQNQYGVNCTWRVDSFFLGCIIILFIKFLGNKVMYVSKHMCWPFSSCTFPFLTLKLLPTLSNSALLTWWDYSSRNIKIEFNKNIFSW